MKRSLGFVLLPLIILSISSLASGLSLTASIGCNSGTSSTHVVFGATVDDYANEHVILNSEDGTLSNRFYGSGSLPFGVLSITDTKGDSATVYRSVSGKPGVTSWNYDWMTYRQYGGVGAKLSFTTANAYSFQGGSYGSNLEGDYAHTAASGSSPSGVTGAFVSNLNTFTNAYPDNVYSTLSANLGTGASTICFDSSSYNREGDYTYQYLDAYGTARNPGKINSPNIYADSIKTLAQSGASTPGASGTSAILRTHAENKARMIGHKSTYNTGGGDFGINMKNYQQLTGSVYGLAYGSFPNQAVANNVFLYSSVNVPSYRTAYLLDPYRREAVVRYGTKDWGYDAFNALMNKGLAVTYYRDSAVSRSRVGDMDNYYVSAILSHASNNGIQITRASESNRVITGSDLKSMFTNNPQGLAILAGCQSFYPSDASSPLANAVRSKEWLSGGFTVNEDYQGLPLFMSNFYNYLAGGNTARTAANKATTDVYNTRHVSVTPTWTPSNHDFYLQYPPISSRGRAISSR